jgi:hypothetical protein
MNAVIFYAMGQKFLANRIHRLLAEHGDMVRCRDIEINNSEWNLERHEIEAIKEYVGYLNAARRNPDRTFFIPVSDGNYIKYIMVRYLNYTAVKLDLELTDNILPAVALDNRMVIMPLGVLDKLTWEGEAILKDQNEDDYFGISEADYLSEESLRNCLREKIAISMNNIERGIANYLGFHSGVTEVEQIAEAMDITVACAQAVVNRIMSLDHGELVAGFCSSRLKAKEWQSTTLCLTNNSTAVVRYIGVEIEGPVEIRKLSLQGVLPPYQSVLLPLHIKPIETGDFPLDIRLLTIEADREVLKSVGVEWVTIT